VSVWSALTPVPIVFKSEQTPLIFDPFSTLVGKPVVRVAASAAWGPCGCAGAWCTGTDPPCPTTRDRFCVHVGSWSRRISGSRAVQAFAPPCCPNIALCGMTVGARWLHAGLWVRELHGSQHHLSRRAAGRRHPRAARRY
jgi:hypothetical protein